MTNRYEKADANCPVWSPEDHSYVSQMSALDIKKKELGERTLTNANEDQTRVKDTTSKRRSGSIRPL
jgi:hypothetical protein